MLLRKVAVARIRSANVCAEGTSRANWIALISKLILCNGARIRAGDRFGLDRAMRDTRPALEELMEDLARGWGR